jgi:hypothetical protein
VQLPKRLYCLMASLLVSEANATDRVRGMLQDAGPQETAYKHHTQRPQAWAATKRGPCRLSVAETPDSSKHYAAGATDDVIHFWSATPSHPPPPPHPHLPPHTQTHPYTHTHAKCINWVLLVGFGVLCRGWSSRWHNRGSEEYARAEANMSPPNRQHTHGMVRKFMSGMGGRPTYPVPPPPPPPPPPRTRTHALLPPPLPPRIPRTHTPRSTRRGQGARPCDDSLDNLGVLCCEWSLRWPNVGGGEGVARNTRELRCMRALRTVSLPTTCMGKLRVERADVLAT